MDRRKWTVVAGCAAVAGLAALLAVGAVVTFSLLYRPGAQTQVAVRCEADAPPLPRGHRIRALVWNVQYAAGRAPHFFYDGGADVSVDRPTVERTLDAIAEVIRRTDPDIVLLQEVDRGSRRTVFVDQHEVLLQAVPYPCHASTPYHRAVYVPHPPHEHLGRVDMHLSVFSRYRLDRAVRHQLALLDESWVRRQFNLRRALLEIDVPLADGGRLVLFNTHLSAFSRGDGTVARQMAAIDARLAAAEDGGAPWVLGADLNTLPPGDDPERLGAHAELYRDGSQVAPLIERYHWPVPADELAADPQPWRTYLPWGAEAPDRTIDYVLHGERVAPHGFSVLSDVTDVSDHLPMVFDFQVR